MGNLNEVVQLGALLDHGSTHSGTVDGRVGSNLDIVLENDDTHLGNLLIGAVLLGSEAEAVATDNSTALHNAAVADAAAMVNLHAGIQDDVVTQGNTVTHIHLRINLDVLADGHAIADVGKRADVHIVGQLGALAHVDGLFDTAFLGTLAVHEVEQIGERLVGVIDTNQGGFHLMLGLEVLADENCRGLGRVHVMSVFGIGQKRQAACGGLFDFSIVVNHGRCVAVDCAVNHCCKLLCSNFHDV